MSRLWENGKPTTTPPYQWTLRPRVIDIRDDGAVAGVSVRYDDNAVVMTLPMGPDNDLDVIFSPEMARLVAVFLGDLAPCSFLSGDSTCLALPGDAIRV